MAGLWWILAFGMGALALAPRAASAQSGYLQAGDVAVTCVDTSGSADQNTHDKIQITPLVPLPALTDDRYQIEYTDFEANADGVFYTYNENIGGLEVGGAKGAGEPATDNNVDGLVGPDEQVFIFQGSLDSDSGVLFTGELLWGFQMSTAGGWATTRMDELSELPTSLENANVAVTTNDNVLFAYTGPTTGTRAQLQVAIADPTNWTGGATCPTSFTVIPTVDGDINGTDGGAGDGEDTSIGADHSDSDAAITDGPSRTVDSGAGESDGGGAGGRNGAGGDIDGLDGTSAVGGASGTGGASGVGGISGAGGTGGVSGNAGSGGVTGGGGAMTIAGIGGAAGALDGDQPGAGGAHAGVADGAVQDATGDAGEGTVETGCGCAVGGTFAESLMGVAWIAFALPLLRRRRRRSANARATGRRWGRGAGRSD